jgi:hypothetical protein
MAKQLICGLTALVIATSFIGSGAALAWTVASPQVLKPYIEVGKKLKYKVVKKNTHICLCQGNNYCSCSVGHIVPLN